MEQQPKKEFTNSLLSLGVDGLETAIDLITDSEIIKNLPVVGSVVGLAKIGFAIPNLIFVNKVNAFLLGAKAGQDAMDKFADQITISTVERQQAGEVVCQTLDALDDVLKAKMVGALYAKYLVGRLEFHILRRLCSTMSRVFVDDLMNFRVHARAGTITIHGFEVSLLNGSGLVVPVVKHVEYGEKSKEQDFKVTDLGQQFLDALLGVRLDP